MVPKVRARSRVGKVQARNVKTLSAVGLHKGIRQHIIGKPKNYDVRKQAATYLKSLRKGGK